MQLGCEERHSQSLKTIAHPIVLCLTLKKEKKKREGQCKGEKDGVAPAGSINSVCMRMCVHVCVCAPRIDLSRLGAL